MSTSQNLSYGIRSIQQMQQVTRPSDRQTKRRAEARKYFVENVDPIIARCITYMLCAQPDDVPNAMLEYFLNLKENQPIIFPSASGKPRKDQRVFLATSIGPVISKLANRVALARPQNVSEYLYNELKSMINFENGIFGKEYDQKGDLSAPEQSLPQSKSVSSQPVTVPAQPIIAKQSTSETAKSETKSNTTKNIQIALLGAGGAGKSSVINYIQCDFESAVKPTVGFRPISLMLGEDCRVQLYDLGGGKKIRDIWNQYFHDVHGVIYVFDGHAMNQDNVSVSDLCVGDVVECNFRGKGKYYSAKIASMSLASQGQDTSNEMVFEIHYDDGEVETQVPLSLVRRIGDNSTKVTFGDINDASTLFHSTVSHSFLAGKPTLVLSNKQDLPGSLSASELSRLLSIETMSGVRVMDGACRPGDNRIELAVEWLLSEINASYDDLNCRVVADSAKKAQEEAKKRLERERKVLRNKIASAFSHIIDPLKLPEGVTANPEDVFSEEEGLPFLAAEIGEDASALSVIARDIASMVGYQRLALQIIGALKSPISKKKTPMTWEEIREIVAELRSELGLP